MRSCRMCLAAALLAVSMLSSWRGVGRASLRIAMHDRPCCTPVTLSRRMPVQLYQGALHDCACAAALGVQALEAAALTVCGGLVKLPMWLGSALIDDTRGMGLELSCQEHMLFRILAPHAHAYSICKSILSSSSVHAGTEVMTLVSCAPRVQSAMVATRAALQVSERTADMQHRSHRTSTKACNTTEGVQ